MSDPVRENQERRDSSADLGATAGARRPVKTLALLALVTSVYVLHQDFWNWERIEPLVFGVIPAGLAYHLAYSVVASLMMVVLVRCAWPVHLEKHESKESPASGSDREDRP